MEKKRESCNHLLSRSLLDINSCPLSNMKGTSIRGDRIDAMGLLRCYCILLNRITGVLELFSSSGMHFVRIEKTSSWQLVYSGHACLRMLLKECWRCGLFNSLFA